MSSPGGDCPICGAATTDWRQHIECELADEGYRLGRNISSDDGVIVDMNDVKVIDGVVGYRVLLTGNYATSEVE